MYITDGFERKEQCGITDCFVDNKKRLSFLRYKGQMCRDMDW